MAPEAPELRQQQQLRRSRSVDVDLHGPRSAALGHRQLEDRTPKALVGGQQRRPDGLSGHDRRHTVLHLPRKMRRCASLGAFLSRLSVCPPQSFHVSAEL